MAKLIEMAEYILGTHGLTPGVHFRFLIDESPFPLPLRAIFPEGTVTALPLVVFLPGSASH